MQRSWCVRFPAVPPLRHDVGELRRAIVAHPGWLDDRYCPNGLWDYADADGQRAIEPAPAEELRRLAPRLEAAAMLRRRKHSAMDSAPFRHGHCPRKSLWELWRVGSSRWE
jgi:hypothetical protein